MKYCYCERWNEYPKVNAYCHRWFSTIKGSYCLLKGGSVSRHCPGARKLAGKEIYFTSDESICNASIGKFR